MLFLAEEPPVDIQPVVVDPGGLGGHGSHGGHGSQPWTRHGDIKKGDSDQPWIGGDFNREPSTWSEATPPSGSAGAPHLLLGPHHIVSLVQILLFT